MSVDVLGTTAMTTQARIWGGKAAAVADGR